jgi:hypothetical protein
MASAAIDHLISITVFLAAILLFINLFNQTNQTAIIYEHHRAVATKCSDVLDSMLLNPGNPSDWGENNNAPTSFGVQDPEFTQYQLSPFSLMRLASSTGDTVIYDKTSPYEYYRGTTMGFGKSLLMPSDSTVNYSLALKLLGINNTYGFQLTLTPIVAVSVLENHAANPLSLSLSITGASFPLAQASISYCLILVSLPQAEGEYPSYTLRNGTTCANGQGSASVAFPEVTDEHQSYAFIAYAHLGGLVGVGSYERVSSADQYVVPIVGDISAPTVLIAHNYDLNSSGQTGSSLKYNVTFVLLTEDFTLREMPLETADVAGYVTSGVGYPLVEVSIPTYTPGILLVTYQKSASEGGVVMMPWGISALAFPVTYGGDPQQQEWVATDLRQVTINHIVYQAKLAVWSTKGWQVNG